MVGSWEPVHGDDPCPGRTGWFTGTGRKFSRRVPRLRRLVRVVFVGIFAPSHGHVTGCVAGASAPSDPAERPTKRIRRDRDAARVERDRDRFDDFYRSQYPIVVRLAYSLCGSMTVAEELAQEAFVSAHDRWRRIAGFDRPDLWVRRVVINRSISYRRKLASERRALERVSRRPLPAEEPLLADEELWDAMRELSPRQAEVLALVYVEDRPIAEVATILCLGEETIRTHLKRGRSALADKLLDVERGRSR